MQKAVLKYREFRENSFDAYLLEPFRFMTAKSTSPQSPDTKQPCKHPRVQIVGRDEESEFVECKECGEIFDSSEFKDMNIEERTQEQETEL